MKIMKTRKKELQMPKKVFYETLKRLLQYHTLILNLPKKHRDECIKLYGSLEDYSISNYDDFYEFLEHWKDYKERK